MQPYLKDPAAIYAKSFATVRAKADLTGLPEDVVDVAIRFVHACGMPDILNDLQVSRVLPAARSSLDSGSPIFCDCAMVASGITRKFLSAGNDVVVTLNDPSVPAWRQSDTTRSAAAVDLWTDRLEGALVVIGNAPTALFRLLKSLMTGGARRDHRHPAGFVGAAESSLNLHLIHEQFRFWWCMVPVVDRLWLLRWSMLLLHLTDCAATRNAMTAPLIIGVTEAGVAALPDAVRSRLATWTSSSPHHGFTKACRMVSAFWTGQSRFRISLIFLRTKLALPLQC